MAIIVSAYRPSPLSPISCAQEKRRQYHPHRYNVTRPAAVTWQSVVRRAVFVCMWVMTPAPQPAVRFHTRVTSDGMSHPKDRLTEFHTRITPLTERHASGIDFIKIKKEGRQNEKSHVPTCPQMKISPKNVFLLLLACTLQLFSFSLYAYAHVSVRACVRACVRAHMC